MVDAREQADGSREQAGLRVYYDSSCPLCRREVGFYQRLDGAGRIDWVDLCDPAAPSPAADGIPRDAALGRLHAVPVGDRPVSGARAFAAIWARIPGLRLLGRVMGVPPFVWLAELGYRGFLRIRPFLSGGIARLEGRSR